jgi:Flp pilus assembly protein TadG
MLIHLTKRRVRHEGGTRAAPGQALVEFAIIAPLLITLLTAVAVFGVAFNNDLELSFATDTSAQQLAISRGQITDPCKTTYQAAFLAAPQLTQASMKFTITLNGTAATTNTASPSCTGSLANLVQNTNATVKVTYPCNISIFGMNPVPNCTLTAQTAVYVQ